MKYRHLNLKKGLGIGILCLSLTNCEELVDIDLPNNQLNTENIFSDPDNTKLALSNLYSNLRETPLFQGGTGLNYDLGKYTDELESFKQEDYIYLNSLNASSSPTHKYWDQSYANLYQINAFIEGVSASSKIEEATKNVYLGEAYFLRALYYHYLCQLYDDLPYITTTNYKINSQIAKTPYLQVLDLVEKDLKVALEFLENNYRHPDRIYPNKAVVELLLAKNYLLQKRYDLTEIYAQKVLDNPLYALETDLDNVFKKNAQSTMWQMSPNESGANYSATHEATYFIFDGSVFPTVDVALSPSLLNSFSPNDTRLQHWIKTYTDGTTTYSHVYKYKNKGVNTDEFSIRFRLEEAYFIKAEALAYQEKVSEALDILNEIRIKRGLSPLPNTLNKADFVTEILSEYQREFFTEGAHRFLDLKRNNRLQVLETFKPNWEAKHTLLPIPETEILMNENLKPQNHGY